MNTDFTPSIASDIEELVSFVNASMIEDPKSDMYKKAKQAAGNVEAFLATFTPNHLDEREIDH